jgi:hypothetical protein
MIDEGIIAMSSRDLKRLRVVHKALNRQITQKMAASMIGVSERQLRRILRSVREEGDGGVIHKGRGRPSNRRISARIKAKVLKLYRTNYVDFGPTLASEKLLERDGLKVSVETLRQWLMGAGLWEKRRKRRDHRKWRVRKECFGQMVQMDGSHHAWLEDRGPELVLMGYIDDATSNVYGRFYDYEGTMPAMDSFKRYVRKYGLPMSLYLDKHTTYKSNRKLTVEEELDGQSRPLSQFERAVAELGVELIHADSPEAKGRVERLFGVLQDRLVKEMRLEKIKSKEEANRFLKQYLPKHNKKFRVSPKNKTNIHVKPEPYSNLDKYLCLKTQRTVRNDQTVAHNKKLYQIEEKITSRKVIVEERLNGSLHISSKGVSLKYREITERPKKETSPKRSQKLRKANIPPKDHPWRKSTSLKSIALKKMYQQLTK